MLVAGCLLKVDTKCYNHILLHRLSDLVLVILLMAEILQLIGSLSHYLHGFKRPRWLFGISSVNSIFWSPKSTNIITQPLFLSVFGGFISLGQCQKKLRRPWHHSSANPASFLERGVYVSVGEVLAISRKMSASAARYQVHLYSWICLRWLGKN